MSSLPRILAVVAVVVVIIIVRQKWYQPSVEELLALNLFLAGAAAMALHRASRSHLTIAKLALAVTVLYGLAVPLTSWLLGDRQYSTSTTQLILTCVATAIAFQALGSSLSFKDPACPAAARPPGFYRHLWLLGVICLLVGATCYFFAVMLSGGWQDYLAAGYNERFNIKRQSGPIELGMYWAIGGVVAMFAARFGLGNARKSDLIYIAPIVVAISLLGIRRPILYLLLPLAFAIYQVQRRSWPRIVLVSVAAACLLVTFANYRQILASSGIVATKEFVSRNASWDWMNPADNELGAPYRVFGDMAERQEFPRGPLPSYVFVVHQMIPRFLFPDRPENLSEWYTRNFFSTQFVSIGGNMGFYSLAEAYLNAGYLGVAAIFFVFGRFCSYLDNVLDCTYSPTVYWLILLSIPYVFFMTRIDFASGVKGYMLATLLPVVMLGSLGSHLKVR